MTALIFVMAVLLGDSSEKTRSQHFDRMELSTVDLDYGNGAKSQYVQVIFSNWSPDYRRYHIEAWMLPRGLHEYPKYVNGKYACKWRTYSGQFHITADLFIETHTARDPERVQKDMYPESMRIGFLQLKVEK